MGAIKLSNYQKESLAGHLEGKTIVAAEITDSSLKLTLHDKTVIEASAKSGFGLDGNWYNSTEIEVNGIKIVDK